MTKIVRVLLLAVGLSVFSVPFALADAGSAQDAAQTNPAKSRKAYLQQQKKQQKKAKKALKKSEKKWKKEHQAGY